MKKESVDAVDVAESVDAVESVEPAAPARGVTLAWPVVREDRTITYVEIGDTIKQSGSLRGLSLADVLSLKTESVVTLLTRVTSPRLKESEVKSLATADFVALSQAIVPFLMPTGAKSAEETESY